MSDRNPRLLLEDIIEAANKIKLYTSEKTYDSFIADSKTIDAVIRNFEIIGEAAKRLPDTFKEKYPQIEWFRIIGFRNRIVHDYMGIDYQIVWTIIENYLNNLIAALNKIQEEL